MGKKLLVIVLLCCVAFFCVQWSRKRSENHSIERNSETRSVDERAFVSTSNLKLDSTRYELPAVKSSDRIIHHFGYSLLYNEAHEQASWVAYELTGAETNKLYERTDRFITDPLVSSGTATDSDYKNSGYDRGHLAPASDMGWSDVAMVESFYYSNMSPQLPGFNRGIWKSLEECVRTWAIDNESIYVVTGPVLTAGLSTIGSNKVSVPNYYYKVILDYREPGVKGIGFVLPNQSSSLGLQNFVVSIDSVEHLTGINFYPSLPDSLENAIEQQQCVSCWNWYKKSSNSSGQSQNKSGSSTAVQCSGITKSGERCKRMTKSPNGRCYQH